MFTIERVGNCAIVHLTTDIEHENFPAFKQRLEDDIMSTDNVVVVIDLKAVNYLCSAAFGMFSVLAEALRRHDGKVFMLNLNERGSKMFNMLGLNEVIEVIPAEDGSLPFAELATKLKK